jgi:hypothetical protein
LADKKGQRAMVWFFTRDRERVQMDTFYDNDANEFVIRLYYPDGTQSVERFRSLAHFREGVENAEQRLLAERWTQDGTPIVIPQGFPKRRLN